MKKPVGEFPSKYDKIGKLFEEALKPKCDRCGEPLPIYAFYDEYYEIRHCEHCGYTNRSPRKNVKKNKLVFGNSPMGGKSFIDMPYKCPSCKTSLEYSHEDDECVCFSCPNCYQLVLARKG